MPINLHHILLAWMLFSLVALSSCTRVIDFEGEETDPLLVVKATLHPYTWHSLKENQIYYGYIFYHVQSTQFFLDTTKKSLLEDDVVCYLQHNDDPFIEINDGRYNISEPINVGDVFRLKVCHPDYPTVIAEVVVPDLDDTVVKIDANSFQFVPRGILDKPSYQFDFIIDSKTKKSSNNAILLEVHTDMKTVDIDMKLGASHYSSFSYWWSNDPIITNNLLHQTDDGYMGLYQESNCMAGPVLFPTADITSWPYRFSFMIPAEAVRYDFNGEKYDYDEIKYLFESCTFHFTITNSEYLEYLRMMYMAESGHSILSEPVVVTCQNVEGGLGYFNVENIFYFELTKDDISELLSKQIH